MIKLGTTSILNQSESILNRAYRALKETVNIKIDNKLIEKPDDSVMNVLFDDLNFSKILLQINKIVDSMNEKNTLIKEKEKLKLLSIGKLIGLFNKTPENWFKYGQVNNETDIDKIEQLITKRNEARKNKNFGVADAIRTQLNNMEIEIEDTLNKTVWRKK